MPTRNVQTLSTPATSGADSGFLSDANGLTVAALGLTGVTAGGALFVGATVLPAQVFGGLAAAGALAVGGEVKNRTGHYLPFLHDKKDADTESAPTNAEAAPAAAA